MSGSATSKWSACAGSRCTTSNTTAISPRKASRNWNAPRTLSGWRIFIDRFFTPQGLGPFDDVTRIEWRYLTSEAS